MISKTIKVTHSCGQETVVLGRQYENDAVQVLFDCSALAEEHGSGSAGLYVKRNKDKTPYLATSTKQDGNVLTWTVTTYDTAVPGAGALELRWKTDEGDTSARPILFRTVVLPGLGETTGETEEVSSWLDQLLDSVQEKLDSSLQEAKDSGEFTGATPDITMSAAVDQTVGTPAVSVTKTGTAENPAFSLAFSGIKGETGDCNLVAFEVENGELYANYTIDDSELSFSLTDGNLEVEING